MLRLYHQARAGLPVCVSVNNLLIEASHRPLPESSKMRQTYHTQILDIPGDQLQPRRKSAVILRYPYRPYWLASSTTRSTSAPSSSAIFGSCRCAERACPRTRHARLSLTGSLRHATSMAWRRRAGLTSSPGRLPQNRDVESLLRRTPLPAHRTPPVQVRLDSNSSTRSVLASQVNT